MDAAVSSLGDGVGSSSLLSRRLIQNGAQESCGAEAGSGKKLGQGVVSQGCPELPLTIPSFGLAPWLQRNVLT